MRSSNLPRAQNGKSTWTVIRWASAARSAGSSADHVEPARWPHTTLAGAAYGQLSARIEPLTPPFKPCTRTPTGTLSTIGCKSGVITRLARPAGPGAENTAAPANEYVSSMVCRPAADGGNDISQRCPGVITVVARGRPSKFACSPSTRGSGTRPAGTPGPAKRVSSLSVTCEGRPFSVRDSTIAIVASGLTVTVMSKPAGVVTADRGGTDADVGATAGRDAGTDVGADVEPEAGAALDELDGLGTDAGRAAQAIPTEALTRAAARTPVIQLRAEALHTDTSSILTTPARHSQDDLRSYRCEDQ